MVTHREDGWESLPRAVDSSPNTGDGRLSVGLVMLFPSGTMDGYEPTGNETLWFAVNRLGAGGRESDDLLRQKGPIRPPEQDATIAVTMGRDKWRAGEGSEAWPMTSKRGSWSRR